MTDLDSAVGEVVKKLRDLGQLENTILVVTSDNGPRTGPAGTEQVTSRLVWQKHT